MGSEQETLNWCLPPTHTQGGVGKGKGAYKPDKNLNTQREN